MDSGRGREPSGSLRLVRRRCQPEPDDGTDRTAGVPLPPLYDLEAAASRVTTDHKLDVVALHEDGPRTFVGH